MCTINSNAVQSHLSENYSTENFFLTFWIRNIHNLQYCSIFPSSQYMYLVCSCLLAPSSSETSFFQESEGALLPPPAVSRR